MIINGPCNIKKGERVKTRRYVKVYETREPYFLDERWVNKFEFEYDINTKRANVKIDLKKDEAYRESNIRLYRKFSAPVVCAMDVHILAVIIGKFVCYCRWYIGLI